MSAKQVWQSGHYDLKLGFVSEYGKDVVRLLQPAEGERILDLGCGTGDLTNEIAGAGSRVTGMDLSKEMIEEARGKYPDIEFLAGNAEAFRFDEKFDAVFSNAALHWMKQPERVLEAVWDSLRSGGRFVAEFGGKGNVGVVVSSIFEVLSEDYGIDAEPLHPWYFPSIGEYSVLLERQGFRVMYAIHFDRPTRIDDHELGLAHWLKGFADSFFQGFSEEEKSRAYARIADKARPFLFDGESWLIDYKRLRILAVKPSREV